eukprot:COSAG03_NODE_13647_length_494_cov_0.784810_1_plen_32_part_10
MAVSVWKKEKLPVRPMITCKPSCVTKGIRPYA